MLQAGDVPLVQSGLVRYRRGVITSIQPWRAITVFWEISPPKSGWRKYSVPFPTTPYLANVRVGDDPP